MFLSARPFAALSHPIAFLAFILACCLPRTTSAGTTVYSSNGYQVNIDILFVSLVPHANPCPWGYN